MTRGEVMFHSLAVELPDSTEGKLFGAMCIKAPNGKAGVMFKDGAIIIKLEAAILQEALRLDGAHIFDPMGGRPMGGWVQLSEAHIDLWRHYAAIAMETVKKIEVVKKSKK